MYKRLRCIRRADRRTDRYLAMQYFITSLNHWECRPPTPMLMFSWWIAWYTMGRTHLSELPQIPTIQLAGYSTLTESSRGRCLNVKSYFLRTLITFKKSRIQGYNLWNSTRFHPMRSCSFESRSLCQSASLQSCCHQMQNTEATVSRLFSFEYLVIV